MGWVFQRPMSWFAMPIFFIPFHHTVRARRLGLGLGQAMVIAGLWGACVHAAPAPWYYWRSTVDGSKVCAQTSPGHGWERDSAAYDGPGCHPRRKVLVIPMR